MVSREWGSLAGSRPSVAAEGIGPEQAVEEAIARIKQILAE